MTTVAKKSIHGYSNQRFSLFCWLFHSWASIVVHLCKHFPLMCARACKNAQALANLHHLALARCLHVSTIINVDLWKVQERWKKFTKINYITVMCWLRLVSPESWLATLPSALQNMCPCYAYMAAKQDGKAVHKWAQKRW